ncbi:MAG: dipeptidase PepV [Eubacteriales bacterium]|nr:dipeptidase PepV [Eubacteriales bacterium]MDY3332347.1 dipeptidase PepV [Gallibacter sp.]
MTEIFNNQQNDMTNDKSITDLKNINLWIDNNFESLVNNLKALIKINSIPTLAVGNLPFGENIQEAFEFMLNMADKDGFKIKNIDNYGGHIELIGNGDNKKTMGILAHLDVVPAGENNWIHPPFDAIIEDGKLYGRGAIDDKGPTMAAYFAMKAIKESKIELSNNVHLILGLDEETSWKGMDYYLKKVNAPDFGFTPDSDFPVVQCEKGILVFDLVKKLGKSSDSGFELKRLEGGSAYNMVADYATATIFHKNKEIYDKIKIQAKTFSHNTGYNIYIKGSGNNLILTTKGISAHGAMPEKGLNAISILLAFLADINFNNEDINSFIEFYNRYIAFETDGKSANIDFADNESGNTAVNIGIIKLEKSTITLSINVRMPISVSDEDFYLKLKEVTEQYNFGIVKSKYQPPISFSSDDSFIQTLMEIYQKHTEDYDTKPLVIGGGTYARAMDNFVAFGALFPGEKEVAHQPNEYISLESLKKATYIYAEAIYRLCI